jgi:hypothetical protein
VDRPTADFEIAAPPTRRQGGSATSPMGVGPDHTGEGHTLSEPAPLVIPAQAGIYLSGLGTALGKGMIAEAIAPITEISGTMDPGFWPG